MFTNLKKKNITVKQFALWFIWLGRLSSINTNFFHKNSKVKPDHKHTTLIHASKNARKQTDWTYPGSIIGL